MQALVARLLRIMDTGILPALPLVFLMSEIVAGARGGEALQPASGWPAPGTLLDGGLLRLVAPVPVILLLLGDRLGDALQDAQAAQGIFASDSVSLRPLVAGLAIAAAAGVAFRVAWLVWESDGSARLPKDWRLATVGVWSFGWPSMPSLVAVGAIVLDVATPIEAAGLGVVVAVLLAGLSAGVRREVVLVGFAAGAAAMLLRVFVDLRLTRVVIPTGGKIAIAAAVLCLIVLVACIGLVAVRLAKAKAAWIGRSLGSAAGRAADLFLLLAGSAAALLVFDAVGGRAALAYALGRLPAVLTWLLTLSGGALVAGVEGSAFATVLYLPLVGAVALALPAQTGSGAAVLFGILFMLAMLAGLVGRRSAAAEPALMRFGVLAFSAVVTTLLAWLVPGLYGGIPRV
ncbi:MAG: hypothetical protein U1E56_11335 [Bauldia sp.]